MTDFDQMTNYANYIKDHPFRHEHQPFVLFVTQKE